LEFRRRACRHIAMFDMIELHIEHQPLPS